MITAVVVLCLYVCFLNSPDKFLKQKVGTHFLYQYCMNAILNPYNY